MKGHWESRSTFGKSLKDSGHDVIRIIGQNRDGQWVTSDKKSISNYDLTTNYVHIDPSTYEELKVVNPLFIDFKPTVYEYQETPQQLLQQPPQEPPKITTTHSASSPLEVIFKRMVGGNYPLTLRIDIPIDLDKVKKAIDILNLDINEVTEYITNNLVLNNPKLVELLNASIKDALQFDNNDISFIKDVLNQIKEDDSDIFQSGE
jgi:spore coat protein CotF